MATTLKNSSFKIKAGHEVTSLGLVPEAGAVIFINALQSLAYGDGFNWIVLQEQVDSLAMSLLPAQLYELTDDTPVAFSVFDLIVYNIGDSYTPEEVGQQVTILNAGDYQFNISYEISADSNRATVNMAIVINGVAEPGYDQYLAARDEFYTQVLSFPKTFEANDVITFQIKVDGNDDVTVRSFTIGIQKII